MKLSPRAFLAIAGLLGLTSGLMRPTSISTAPSINQAEFWRLPESEVLLRHHAGSLEYVGNIRWDASQGAADGASDPNGLENEPAWHFRGIVGGTVSFALIELAGTSRLERVGAGEKLPDGSTLLSIDANSIMVLEGSCRSRHMLHQPNDAPQRDCAADPENP